MLERSDIVSIVHVAWKEQFARVEQNKRAIVARGHDAQHVPHTRNHQMFHVCASHLYVQ
jgi:hypothetical protein